MLNRQGLSKKGWLGGFFAVVAAAAPLLALAQDAPVPDQGDTTFMMLSTVLVILMIVPGLALFYGGLVRSKNILSVLTQVFTIFCLISLLWVFYGYSLAFGDVELDDRRYRQTIPSGNHTG